jgi:membrane protein DedA with SNARE-associated domain
MEQHLFDLLARDGVWVLFAAQVFGILGLPIPDDLLLTFAGGFVRRGDLGGPATFAAAIGGSLIGVTFSYTLGRFGGRVLRRLPAINSDTLDRVNAWFSRWGKWMLVFGCFVPGVRHLTPLAAGSAGLRFPTFCAYAYPGAALWSTTLVAIGYYAGAIHPWKHATLLIHTHFVLVAITIGTLVLIYAFASRGLWVQDRQRVD